MYHLDGEGSRIYTLKVPLLAAPFMPSLLTLWLFA